MKPTLPRLLLAAVLMLCAGSIAADTVNEDRITDADIRHQRLIALNKIAAEELALITNRVSIAKQQLELQIELLKVAKKATEVAQEELTAANIRTNAKPIRVTEARIILVAPVSAEDSAIGFAQAKAVPSCDAAPFLKYHCDGKPDCRVPLDRPVCPLPGGETDTFYLKAEYFCGENYAGGTIGMGVRFADEGKDSGKETSTTVYMSCYRK